MTMTLPLFFNKCLFTYASLIACSFHINPYTYTKPIINMSWVGPDQAPFNYINFQPSGEEQELVPSSGCALQVGP